MLENKKAQNSKIHYAWFILLGCCMLQGGTLGAVTNIAGLFYVPVCAELGFSVGQISLYRTIMGVVALVTLPFASKLLSKYDSRIILTGAVLIFVLPTIAMSRFNSVIQWYVAGAIQGLSANLVSIITAPLILTNWFKKKTGLVIGISTASAGLFGALFNYLVSVIIGSLGWRMGYLISGAVALVIVLIATLFILQYRPEDMGMSAYGADDVAEQKKGGAGSAVEWTDRERKERLLLVLVAAVCAGVAGAFSSFLNAFGVSVGLSIRSAALLASIGMIGNTVGKLIIGEMNDRLGARWPCLLGYGVTMIGGLLMLVTKEPLIFVATLLFGVSMPVYTTLMPLLTRAALGEEDFSVAYSKVTMAASMTASLLLTGHGWFYDVTGSYTCSMLLCSVAMGIGSLISLKLFFVKQKR